MRRVSTKFLFLKVMMLALLATIPTAYGQGRPDLPGSGSGGAANQATIIQRSELVPSEQRVGRDLRFTWLFNPGFSLPDGTAITIRVVVNGKVCEPPLANGVVGEANADGSRSCTLTHVGQGLPEAITTRTPVMLRVSVQGVADSSNSDIPFVLLPANRQPVINGTLSVPTEAVGDSTIAVGTSANITDPDGDRLSFKIEKHVSTMDRWVQVAAGDALPLNLRLDPSGTTACTVNYRLCAEEVDTEQKYFIVPVEFAVTLKALSPGGQSPGAPPPPAADPGHKPDTAPVSSAGTAPVASANEAPRNLQVRVRPDTRVVGGQSVGLLYRADDKENDSLYLVVRFNNPANGVAIVMSSTSNPFQLTTPYVPSERRLELQVSVCDGHNESDRQLLELVLLPVERAIVDEREFKDDIKVEQHSMGRRMADAGMFSPGAVDYEFYNDENGNMQVRVRKNTPPDTGPPPAPPQSQHEKKSAAPIKRK